MSRINRFIEALFEDKADYYLIQMQSISNITTTYEGTTFLVSFNLPREFWDRKLKNITIGEYQQLERMTIDANICLSDLDYPPFQLGQTISSVDRVKPLEKIDIWKLIDEVRKGKIKPNYDAISEWCYEQDKS